MAMDRPYIFYIDDITGEIPIYWNNSRHISKILLSLKPRELDVYGLGEPAIKEEEIEKLYGMSRTEVANAIEISKISGGRAAELNPAINYSRINNHKGTSACSIATVTISFMGNTLAPGKGIFTTLHTNLTGLVSSVVSDYPHMVGRDEVVQNTLFLCPKLIEN